MEVSNDEFWQRLQGAVTGADAVERAEHAAAERLLAEVEPVPLAEAQIEAMVRQAIAPDETTVRQVGGPRAAAARQLAAVAASQAPPRSFVRRVLAAAMALVMAPAFLTAATVGAAVYATSLVLRNTTHTLSFQDAIRIMLNEGQADASRDAAQGTVFAVLLDAIDSLRAVTAGETGLASSAEGVLQELRSALGTERPFLWVYADGVPLDLELALENPKIEREERLRALSQLAELAQLGVAALVEMGRQDLPPELARDNEIYLQQLRSALP